jgi:hypothetical protein
MYDLNRLDPSRALRLYVASIRRHGSKVRTIRPALSTVPPQSTNSQTTTATPDQKET